MNCKMNNWGQKVIGDCFLLFNKNKHHLRAEYIYINIYTLMLSCYKAGKRYLKIIVNLQVSCNVYIYSFLCL